MERHYNEQSCWETPYKRVPLFKRDLLLDSAIYTSLIQKRLSHSYQSKHHMCFYDFSMTQDYYSCVSVTVYLVLQY